MENHIEFERELEETYFEHSRSYTNFAEEFDLGSDSGDTPLTLVDDDDEAVEFNIESLSPPPPPLPIMCQTVATSSTTSPLSTKQCYVCYEEHDACEFVYFTEQSPLQQQLSQNSSQQKPKKCCGKNYLCQTCMMRLIKHSRNIRCPICKCCVSHIETYKVEITDKIIKCLEENGKKVILLRSD